jgi:hypothetical protein
MNTLPQHLQFASLVELAEKSASPAREASEAHVSECHQCATQLSRLQQVIALMRTDQTEDAPHNAVAHAMNLFRTRKASVEAASSKDSLGRRILAALSFDSLTVAPAHGVRSGEATAARQLLFSAGENDLDVRLTPAGETWVVSGQVLGNCRGGAIELESAEDDNVVAAATLNDVCEWTLPAVPTGSYRLRVRLGDTEVEVPELDLRA